LAGELATEYKITGWNEGEATQAALRCFTHWRQQRGQGSGEDNAILEAVRDFTDCYGDARFTAINNNELPKTERAGWFNDGVDGRTWHLAHTAYVVTADPGAPVKHVSPLHPFMGCKLSKAKI
jgi:uncharacterized protein (DUF927 family)